MGWFEGQNITEIVRLDANSAVKPDIVHDICTLLPQELVGQFDIVLASHVLEHISYWNAAAVLKSIVTALKDGGELWMMVPDMEYAAHELLIGRETQGLMGLIYGGHLNEWDVHRCGFTRNSLAVIMRKAGIEHVQVKMSAIGVVLNGKSYPAQQLVAHGRKGIRLDAPYRPDAYTKENGNGKLQ